MSGFRIIAGAQIKGGSFLNEFVRRVHDLQQPMRNESQLAILAPISGAFPHLSSERRAHPLRFGPSHLPRLPLKDGDEFVRPDVAFVLGPFLLGELTFGRFGGQIIDPSLKLRVRPIIQDGFGFVRQNDSQNGANPPVERSAFRCRYHSPHCGVTT